jgi:hypothetical protein
MSAHLHPSLLPLLIALKYIPFPMSLTWMIRRTWIATSKQGGLGLLEREILIEGLLLLTRNHLTFTWGEVISFISTHKDWPLGEGFLRHNLAIGRNLVQHKNFPPKPIHVEWHGILTIPILKLK